MMYVSLHLREQKVETVGRVINDTLTTLDIITKDGDITIYDTLDLDGILEIEKEIKKLKRKVKNHQRKIENQK